MGCLEVEVDAGKLRRGAGSVSLQTPHSTTSTEAFTIACEMQSAPKRSTRRQAEVTKHNIIKRGPELDLHVRHLASGWQTVHE